MSGYNFQSELEKSLLNADINLDRKELLEDIFKSYVAKLFEVVLNKSKTKNRIPYEALVEVKRNLINEFRQASLDQNQMSVDQYEKLFDKTVKEIIDFAGSLHEGEEQVNHDQQLSIDKKGFWDGHSVTDTGLIIPK